MECIQGDPNDKSQVRNMRNLPLALKSTRLALTAQWSQMPEHAGIPRTKTDTPFTFADGTEVTLAGFITRIREEKNPKAQALVAPMYAELEARDWDSTKGASVILSNQRLPDGWFKMGRNYAHLRNRAKFEAIFIFGDEENNGLTHYDTGVVGHISVMVGADGAYKLWHYWNTEGAKPGGAGPKKARKRAPDFVYRMTDRQWAKGPVQSVAHCVYSFRSNALIGFQSQIMETLVQTVQTFRLMQDHEFDYDILAALARHHEVTLERKKRGGGLGKVRENNNIPHTCPGGTAPGAEAPGPQPSRVGRRAAH
jgi:hypothetical protein